MLNFTSEISRSLTYSTKNLRAKISSGGRQNDEIYARRKEESTKDTSKIIAENGRAYGRNSNGKIKRKWIVKKVRVWILRGGQKFSVQR